MMVRVLPLAGVEARRSNAFSSFEMLPPTALSADSSI